MSSAPSNDNEDDDAAAASRNNKRKAEEIAPADDGDDIGGERPQQQQQQQQVKSAEEQDTAAAAAAADADVTSTNKTDTTAETAVVEQPPVQQEEQEQQQLPPQEEGEKDPAAGRKNKEDEEGDDESPQQQGPNNDNAEVEVEQDETMTEQEEEAKKADADAKPAETPPNNNGTDSPKEAAPEDMETEPTENVGEEMEVTAAATSPSPTTTTPRAYRNAYDDLKWILVRNDGKSDSMIRLVGLKSLFSKQLPKMPKAYIARLVFDRRHTSLAILSDNPALRDSDDEIIGGICYRSFPEMRFAEIAFCAVNANHQVKGYGTKLMNLLKKAAAATGIEYFITYADNYAIGYFKKQGFTKTITMPRGRYSGLIKEYDGGTPMECYVHPSIDFTRIDEMLDAQRKFILGHVKRNASSHKVYDPLPKDFSPGLEGVSRANHTAARALAIPGVAEAGWTMADLIAATGPGKEADRQRGALKNELMSIVRKVQEQHFSWPFREPVDTSVVPDYAEVIKEPIDLSTMEKRIRTDSHYKSKRMLYADLLLMVENCKAYNDEASTYVQCAVNVEKFLGTLFDNTTGPSKASA